MIHFVLSRILTALMVILGVTLIVFLLIHLVPGDPVEVMLGDSASRADREQLRHALGLDKPMLEQLTQYYQALLALDPGHSIHSGKAVSEIIMPRILPTLYLTISSLTVAMMIAFPLGVIAALKQHTWIDDLAMFISLAGISIPNFLMGPLLILFFALYLGWLPVSGYGGIKEIILPSLTLGTALAAILARMIRSGIIEVLGEDFVRTARAKGLPYRDILFKHVMKNAMLPVVTILGLQIGALLGGAVITEMIFSWPGIGQLMIDSIQKRDYPVVQGCILLISITYVIVNTLTDIVYALLDPRISYLGRDKDV